MKRRGKCLCSMLLVLALVICIMPAAVFGEDLQLIDEISFTFKEPTVGDDIASFISGCKPTVPESEHYTVQGVDTLVEDENDTVLTTGSFQDKTAYRVSFTLKAEDGYAFTSDDENGWFYNGKINGQWNYDGKIQDDHTILSIEYRFAIGLNRIEKLIYTFPEPVEGKTVGSMGKGTISSEPEGAYEGSFNCTWFESEDKTFGTIVSDEDYENKRMSESDTFQAGKYYGVSIEDRTYDIADGYWLDWYTRVLNNGTMIDHEYIFAYFGPLGEEPEGTEVECVWMIFPEPVVGKTPADIGKGSVYGEPEGSIYEQEFDVVWFECEDDTFAFVTEETLETDHMSETDVFQAGYYYAAWPIKGVPMWPNKGYYTPENVELDVANGIWSNNQLLWCQFGPLVATVETPVFSPAETTFRDSIDVTISCPTEGAEIHYTMDGSTPDADSEVTTGAAITLNETTTLKAIAILDGYNDSEVAEATYTLRPNSGGGARPPKDPEPDPVSEPEDDPAGEPAPSANNTFPFTDVPEDSYCRKAVEWALEKGITGGTTETTFSPKAPATRAQVMTFIWAASGSPEPASTENPFTDVSESDYFYKAVLWAYEQGITAGVSADAFGSDETVTRGQIATFLYGVAGRPAAGTEPFTDVDGSDYFADPVAWAYQNGITTGTGADTFSPDADCLREQIITFLYLYFAE